MFALGPFRLDLAGHTLQKDGKALPPPPKALDLLLLLVWRNGELLTKSDSQYVGRPGILTPRGRAAKFD
jgi:DNA-binding winged helix-turn-helix (wHTH) protein